MVCTYICIIYKTDTIYCKLRPFGTILVQCMPNSIIDLFQLLSLFVVLLIVTGLDVEVKVDGKKVEEPSFPGKSSSDNNIPITLWKYAEGFLDGMYGAFILELLLFIASMVFVVLASMRACCRKSLRYIYVSFVKTFHNENTKSCFKCTSNAGKAFSCLSFSWFAEQ